MDLPTWKLTLEYDGTRYHGWQEQKNARTVAGELRSAAESLLSSKVDLIGAGRTDAGVHALAQVARLRTERRTERVRPPEILLGLNDQLPPDINVLAVEETSWNFDPRRDAVARYYLYQISTRRTAFGKRFVWWVKEPLNIDLMQQAAKSLIGRHDFKAFCEKVAEETSTIVVVNRADLITSGDLILFRIGASHFLWKMVRRVVGLLVETGRDRLDARQFATLLNTAERRTSTIDVAARTAPSSGLFLERVVYRPGEAPGPLNPAGYGFAVNG
jgi:tRNA pseudouridine38-40 synthase